MKGLSKILIITIAGAGLSVLLILFLIFPALERLNGINLTIKQQKSELWVLDQQVRAFKNAESDLSKALRKEEINTVILSKEDLVLAVKDLEASANRASTAENLNITDPISWKGADAKTKPPAAVLLNHPGVEEIPFTTHTLSQDWKSLIDFVSLLDHQPRFLELSYISLSADTILGEQKEVINTGKVIGSFKGVFLIKSSEQQ